MLIAKIGSRHHIVIDDNQLLPDGYVVVLKPNPSSNYIAQKDGTWKLLYTKEQALHLRRIAYKNRIDPLISEYIFKSLIGDIKDAEEIKAAIIETRLAIQKEYQFEPDNLLTTDGNSE